MTHNNPRRDIAANARAVMMAAHVVLALGTAVVGWQLTMNWNQLAEILSPTLHRIAAIAAGFGLYFLLDRKILVFLPYAVSVVLGWFGVRTPAVKLDQGKWAMRFFDLLAVGVAVVMFAGTLLTNLVVSPELGDALAADADTGVFGNIVAGNNNTFESNRKTYDRAVERAETALAEVKNAQKTSVSASVSGELRRLASGGNAWAKSEVQKAETRAAQKHRRDLSKAEKNLSKAENALAAFVKTSGGKVDAANGKAIALLEKEVTGAETQKGRWVGMMVFIMWAAGIMFVVACFMVQIYEVTTGDNLTPKVSAGKVFGAFGSKANEGMLSGLARALGVKDRVDFQVQGDGTIVATLPRTATKTDALGRTLSPEQIREREHWNRDAERQKERSREGAEQNLDRNWTEKTQNIDIKTEVGQNAHRTEKQTDTGAGVGDAAYPSPDDREAVKAFVKRFRAASTYRGATDAKVQQQAAWLRANGYRAEIKEGSNCWIITRGGKVAGGVENEYEFDVLGPYEHENA